MALSKIETSSLDVGQIGGRKNVIMNGNFEINQRGVTSYTGLTGFTRGPDRWSWAKNDSVNFDATYGTFSNGFSDIVGARGYMEFTLNSAGAGTDFVTIQQRIEDVRTCAGEEVTLSFWARSTTGSSFTLTEAANIDHGPVAYQQIFGTGGSASVTNRVTDSITLNTAWTKYTYTFTIPSVAGKTIGANNHTRIYLCTMMDSDAGKGVQIAQVQLERGSQASPFEHRSYGEELALCQRYYQYFEGGNYAHVIAQDWGFRTLNCPFPTTMRASPTVVSYADVGGTYTGNPDSVTANTASVKAQWNSRGNGDFMSIGWFRLDAEL